MKGGIEEGDEMHIGTEAMLRPGGKTKLEEIIFCSELVTHDGKKFKFQGKEFWNVLAF